MKTHIIILGLLADCEIRAGGIRLVILIMSAFLLQRGRDPSGNRFVGAQERL